MPSRRSPLAWLSLAALALTASGCRGGKPGGALAPQAVPYSSARPIFTPQPLNPLFISGYARGNQGRAGVRMVPPSAPVDVSEPGLLP